MTTYTARNLTIAAAAAAGLMLAVAPAAQALDQPGDFNVRFSGKCTNNTVAFWRTEAPAGVDPQSFAPLDVEVDVKYVAVKSEVMYPGDYDEVHRYFANNGVPKTVQVYADDTLVASRPYPCGLYSRHH